jgi:hypothetical protein
VSYVFPREPKTWAEGDLAYCVRGCLTGECRPPLERGRVYRVTEAVKPSNVAHHGLRVEGVDVPDGLGGFWSNRFVKLGPVGGRCAQIAAAIEYSPMHYWPGCDFPRHGNRHCRKRKAEIARLSKGEDE